MRKYLFCVKNNNKNSTLNKDQNALDILFILFFQKFSIIVQEKFDKLYPNMFKLNL